MSGKDKKVIMPELIKKGLLKVGKDGKRTIKTRIDRNQMIVRMYHLTPSGSQEKMGDIEGMEEIASSGFSSNVVPFPLDTGSGSEQDFN